VLNNKDKDEHGAEAVCFYNSTSDLFIL